MNAGFSGADVQELRALATTFQDASDRLLRGRMSVGSQIQISAWVGPFATRFRLAWESEHSARVACVARELARIATILRTNADEQAAASAAVGGADTMAPLTNGGDRRPEATPVSSAEATPVPSPTADRITGQTLKHNPYAARYSDQCTFGAQEKFHEYTGEYLNIGSSAHLWSSEAAARGWTTALDAQAHAVVVFQPGVQGADRTYGHVGWVDQTQVRRDGLYAHVVEMNGDPHKGGGPGIYDERWVKDVPGMSYILAPPR